jgi:Ca2+-binding RTX toxin-like protein
MKKQSNIFFDSLFLSDEEKTSGASASKTTSSGLINKRNIIFIDTRVPDYKNLLANIQPDTEVVILDPAKDGIAQITESLFGKQYDSLHIVSHGSTGSLQLGSNYLNSGNLSQYQSQLHQWKTALTEEADILLYGCDVAAGETGVGFVQQLSQLTGADVTASNDLTGNAALGGDWDLEVKTGSIEASLAFKTEVLDSYQYVLPAISLNNFSDTYYQNFNTLANSGIGNPWQNDSTISSWYTSVAAYSAGIGSDNTGGLYSFGSGGSTDRALGSIASNSTPLYYGVKFVNNTGSAINSLRVGYTGEQWRTANNLNPQRLNFHYQKGTNLTSLDTGSWAAVTQLNFNAPIANSTAGALDGNLAANRTVIAPIRINLGTPLAAGEEIMLRWQDIDDVVGTDHGLAIDDFSIQAISSGSQAPVINVPNALSLFYKENDTPISIISGATITDDFTDFDASILTLDITSGSQAGDRISIRNQGNGIGQIGLDGRIINYEGKRIGTYKGGIDTEQFAIIFETANATSQAVGALLNNIVYSNITENLQFGTGRNITIQMMDGDRKFSNIVNRNVVFTPQNDTPIVGNTTTLYNGALGTLPQNQGLQYFGPGVTPTLVYNAANLNTSANDSAQAGFSNYLGATNYSSFTLDRTKGYTISFTARVNSESHLANKNNDGKDDRAGFSVIAISSDGKYGIELGFWQDRIWAQEDGTTQSNPSLEADKAPTSDFRTLFTQAEGITFNTYMGTNSINYDLTVLGDSYTLFANGNSILNGKLRDYSAFPNGTLDVYEKPNFIFFGDNTPSAKASVDLAKVSVTTYSALPGITLDEDTSVVIPNLRVNDIDAGFNNVTVHIKVNNGILTAKSSSGVTINGNSTKYVSLTGQVDQINTALTAVNGLVYKPDQDFNGSDTLTINANDGQGVGISTTSAINVTSINDDPTLTTNNPISVNEGAEVIITNGMLQITDVDNIPSQLTYTITARPNRGSLFLNGFGINYNGATFTQDDINNNRLTYKHGGSETLSDVFGFTATDVLATTRVSLSSAGIQGNGSSKSPSISGNGRYVSFYGSNVNNLVAGDTNNYPDIFVRDIQTGQTTRVSVASDGTQANLPSESPIISDNGRYVIFQSDANNLVANDINNRSDIFVRDTQTNKTTLVSVSSGGTQGNGDSSAIGISADGRYIVFNSKASNLVNNDFNSILSDVFVRDTQTNQTTLVSIGSGGTQSNKDAYASGISSDGRYIVFNSIASNLVANDFNNQSDVFVRDTQTNQTTLISVSYDGNPVFGGSGDAKISGNGRYVAFSSAGNNLVAGDTNNKIDVFVRDTQTNQTKLVSVDLNGISANADSYINDISDDGRYIVFRSKANNLVVGGANGLDNIFVRDTQTNQTTCVSVNSNGFQGNSFSTEASISGDGRYIVFDSVSSNLVIGDTNNSSDIFVYRNTPPVISGNANISVTPVNDAPTFSIGGNQSVQMGATQQTVANWAANFNPGANETSQNLDSYMVNVTDNASIFDVAPTIDATGKLTYKPTTSLPGTGTRSTTATIEVKAKDNGGTANDGVDTSAAQTFKITVYSNTINSITATTGADILTGTDGSDRIDAGNGDDIIYGGLGSDRIIGGGGNDILYGDLENIPAYGVNFTMNDTIYGGIGNDTIYGNGGNDILYGEDGSDTIFGGDGDDQIWGGVGDDILNGGSGKDTFVLVRGQGKETIEDFTLGQDTLGCAGGLKYGSTLGFTTDINGDTLIRDTVRGLDVALVKGITAANLNQSSNFRLM